MQCNNYSNTNVTDAFSDTLDLIEYTLDVNSYNGIIVCGDFNTNFNHNNAQTR